MIKGLGLLGIRKEAGYKKIYDMFSMYPIKGAKEKADKLYRLMLANGVNSRRMGTLFRTDELIKRGMLSAEDLHKLHSVGDSIVPKTRNKELVRLSKEINMKYLKPNITGKNIQSMDNVTRGLRDTRYDLAKHLSHFMPEDMERWTAILND